MSELDREVSFENEKFILAMLHAISGGSIVAVLNQSATIIELSYRGTFLTFMSLMTLALVAAMLASYWKYLYKVWDIKSTADHTQRAIFYLGLTRYAMLASVVLIIAGLASLTISIAVKSFCGA